MAVSFVLEREAASWFTVPAPSITSASFDASVGDVLILVASAAGPSPLTTWSGGAPTNSGSALSWTLVQSSTVASYSPVWAWSAVVDAARTGMTVTLAQASGTQRWGIDLTLWRGASVGASAITTGSGAPSLSLTTTAANSAVLVFDADYNAGSGSSRTWRTGAGAATELVYAYNAGSDATYYGAYHADAGTAAAKTLGLSAPTGQAFTLLAIELKAGTPVAITAPVGAATAAGTAPTVTAPHPAAITATVGAATASGEIPTIITMRDWGEWRSYVWNADFVAAVEARQRTVGFGAEMIDPAGRVVCTLPVTSGSIDFDGESAEQWACSLTVVGGEWVPTAPTDALDPRSGLRCRLSWKIKVGAQWLYVPVGTYWLEDPKIRDGGDAVTIGLTGRDPLSIIRRSAYGAATVILGGLTVPAAIARIMAVVAPQLPLRIDATSTVTLPSPYEVGSRDPLEDVLTIAALGGLIVRSDREGAVLVSLPPAPDMIRADWQEGDDCPVTGLDRGLGTSTMVNSVTVVSTSPDVKPPVSATVEDDDPSSPTYIGGVWGRRGVTIRSDAVASTDAAANLARTTLAGRRRPTESVVVQIPPRGDLSYGDLCSLARAQAGVGGLYRVAKWRLPITEVGTAPPLMSVTMQTRSTA